MENDNAVTEAQLEEVKSLVADVQTAIEERFERLQATVGNESKPKSVEALSNLYLDSLIEGAVSKETDKREKFEAELGEIEQYALGVVSGALGDSGNAGPLVQQQLYAQLTVNTQHQSERPMFSAMGSIPFADYVRFPVVSQGTLVTDRAGQNQTVNGQALQYTMSTFESDTLDGGVAMPYELLRLSVTNPDLASQVREDLRAAYAAAIEAKVVSYWNDNAFNAASVANADAVLFNQESFKAAESGVIELRATSPTLGQEQVALIGATLFIPRIPGGARHIDCTTTSYAAFVEQIATEAIQVKTGSRARATLLAVNSTIWPKLVGLAANANSGIRATSNNTIEINAESFDIPGIRVFHVPGLALV